MMTGSNFFAGTTQYGEEKCFFCGAECEKTNALKDYLKKTFTDLQSVKAPNSNYVCNGCVVTFEESGELTYCTGETKFFPRSKHRLHSFIVTNTGKRIAHTKTHIQLQREAILDIEKNDLPMLITVATSGQRQILFKSVVTVNVENIIVNFEGEAISVGSLNNFRGQLERVDRISSVIGKKNIALSKNINDYFRCHEAGIGKEYEDWCKINKSKISQVLMYFAKTKGKNV